MEIRVVRSVKEKNKELAHDVREHLRRRRGVMFNFMSSPGSGKTTFLEKLVPLLQQRGHRPAIIEGDVTTAIDAERLNHLGIPISLINTEKFGGSCHLGPNVILGALETLASDEFDVVLIENVGNLICPASYDTGSNENFVLLSVTEGEDKPLKYPVVFKRTSASLITKIDLVEPLGFDVQTLRRNILTVNPDHRLFELSSRSGVGLVDFADYLSERAGLYADAIAGKQIDG